MRRMRYLLLSACAMTLCLPASAAAQTARHFGYDAPPASSYRVISNVVYGTSGDVKLAADVFRPVSGEASPAILFFNRAQGEARSNGFYGEWAKVVASKGVVGILPDLRDGSEAADFRLLVPYVIEHARELGIDPSRVSVYAASGNVASAFPAIEDAAMTPVKAAVIYYGYGDVKTFRADLPVLWIRAGLDRPGMNDGIRGLLARALEQNAPVTIVNDAVGHHAFEMFDDDLVTRELIDRTVAFVKDMTAAPYQEAFRAALPEAQAVAAIGAGQFAEAVKIYEGLLAKRGDDPRLRLAYGEALLGDRQFASACAEFEKLKSAGLGFRDLGLPAARACLQKGDADRAVAWLGTIPRRFLGRDDVAKDPVLAPLQSRPDVQALFNR